MDKNLYSFNVTRHKQKDQYVGLCAEFSFLSYLADTDLEAYRGILHLVCDFEEQVEQFHDKVEFDKWLTANTQNAADDSRPVVPHKQVLAEIRAFVEMREWRNSLRFALRVKRMLLSTQ